MLTGEGGRKCLRALVVICAYNEERSIAAPVSRAVEEGFDVLVVDDGSEDRTSEVAESHGATVLRNAKRGGKANALNKAITYAKTHGYNAVIGIDADAIPAAGSISKIYHLLNFPSIGAVSALQIPLGTGLAYKIDELMWAILAIGKSLQQRLKKPVHLGATMYGVKLKYISSLIHVINDDEFLGTLIQKSGARHYFSEDCVVYFDASSSLKHIYHRRKRMILGHLQLRQSTAPSMQLDILVMATLYAIIKKPSRILYLIPGIIIEVTARLAALSELRKGEDMEKLAKWHTYGMKKPIQPPIA